MERSSIPAELTEVPDARYVSERAVERHVTSIFSKLRLEATGQEHRRVLAVLRYLSA